MEYPTVNIGERPVGRAFKTYVVAELSANHRKEFATAARTLVSAAEAGADAFKVQLFKPETMTLRGDRFQASGPWEGRSLYDLYEEAAMPWDWVPRLAAIAEHSKIDFFATVYDQTAVEYMEEHCPPKVYKIASFELTDTPLLSCVAHTGKPVILSTGMATQAEIYDAVQTLYREGAGGVILLHCTSAYPTPITDVNLLTMHDMASKFQVPVGLSDHTPGISASIAASVLRAAVIERHICLDRTQPTPDLAFSLRPNEFGAMVRSINLAELAIGTPTYSTESEGAMKKLRRSIYVVRPMKSGQRFTEEDIAVLRPELGMKPCMYDVVLKSVATRDIPAKTPMTDDMIAPVAIPPSKPASKPSKKKAKKKAKRKVKKAKGRNKSRRKVGKK